MRAMLRRIKSRRLRRAVGYSLAAVILGLVALALIEVRSSAPLKPRAPSQLRAGIEEDSALSSRRGADDPSQDSLLSQAWARALDDARIRLEESLGVFAYRAEPGAAGGQWVRLEALETTPRRAVVLIHGLDDSGTIWDDMAPALVSSGHAALRFDYPNDQSIARSAVRLVQELAILRRAGVEEIDVVCHSMGGLVSREALTHPSGYAGEGSGHPHFPAVRRLIMVGTPQHGSELARFRAVMEVRDQFVRLCERDHLTPSDFLAFLVDGDGQAGHDLLPGSAFLERLNSRPLPADVRITLIVGRVGVMNDRSGSGEVEPLDNSILERTLGERAAGQISAWVDKQLRVIGDGAVSASSAELLGVSDVVYLPSAHRTLLRRMAVLGQSEQPPAIGVVLDRLSAASVDGGLPSRGE